MSGYMLVHFKLCIAYGFGTDWNNKMRGKKEKKEKVKVKKNKNNI